MGNTETVNYNMKDKVAVVTGSNTGIGKEVARKLALFGANVTMACRSIERATAAMEDIKKEIPSASLDVMQVDLGDFDSIKKFSQDLHEKHSHIDILVNNAGVVKLIYEKGKQGHELMLTVNYLGTCLITKLLLDLLEKAPDSNGYPRIVMVASNSHTFPGELSLNQLQFTKEEGQEFSPLDSMQNYGRSKLCLLLYFRILNKKFREKNSRVLVYASDPGWVQTELGRAADDKFYIGIIRAIENITAKKPAEGAISTLYCSCAPELESIENSGVYYSGINELANLSDYAKDDKIAEALWEWTEKELANWS